MPHAQAGCEGRGEDVSVKLMFTRRSIFTRIVLFALVASSAGMLVTGPGQVSAGQGNGAQADGGPVDDHVCEVEDEGTTLCYDAKGEWHLVVSPSGRVQYQMNLSTECWTLFDNATGDVLYFGCDRLHNSVHLGSGGNSVQVATFRLTGSETYDGTTYCFFTDYHEANGTVRYYRSGYAVC